MANSVPWKNPEVLATDNNALTSSVSGSEQPEPHPPRRRVAYTDKGGPQSRGRIVPSYPREMHGAGYEIVTSDQRQTGDPQSPLYAGQLLPPAIPNRDRPRAQQFFDALSVLGSLPDDYPGNSNDR
jgi:hypothetical protein